MLGNYQSAMLCVLSLILFLLPSFVEDTFRITIPPVFQVIIFGFTMDQLFFLDMQKDFIVQEFGSVTLDPANMGTPIDVKGITQTIINTASGETYTIDGGYLDIGILDTMKDLLVNLL
ncbi:MAG: hypothetical protein IJT96_00635 [Lachnospiraceae bacterium]|nr:hypothetical protein [Lachnospiraceae bacterium]